MASVYNLFHILRALVIYYLAYNFNISTITFLIAAAYYIIKSVGNKGKWPLFRVS